MTGAAGFIGSHLCDSLLKKGLKVTGIDNLSFGNIANIPSDSGNFNFHKLDIRDKKGLSELINRIRPKTVFHLAANASVPLSVKEPEFDFENNALGTVNILEVLRSHQIKSKFILASSAAVYGEPGHQNITENTALKPISQYGLSKLIAEMQCLAYAKDYGLPVVIARLFNSYGPRMPRFVVLDFIKKLKDNPNQLEILGDGKQTRDFTFVSDTVAGLIQCAETGLDQQAYNVASGKSTSVTELAQALLRILGLKTKIHYTGQSWGGDAQYWKVDISKIESIGYRSNISLDEGLKSVLNWFENRERKSLF